MKTPCPPRPREHSVPTRAPFGRRLLLASVAGLFGLFVNLEAAPPELKTSGNKIVVKETGVPVRLTGVNIPSLDWGYGQEIMTLLEVAVGSWKANVIRLPVADEFWFGSNAELYRGRIDDFIERASELNVYVILDLHNYVKARTADATFWTSAADRYKNNPAVLFGLLNEPHTITEGEVWRNGDADGPGMQGLLDAVRATGANNIVLAGGLQWGYKLLDILPGYALADTASGNGVVYDSHVYPWKTYIHKDVGNPAQQYPVLLGELGHPGGTTFPSQQPFEAEDTWVPRTLDWVDTQNLHWTAWCFFPGATPRLLDDWSCAPSAPMGSPVKARLLSYANPNALRVVGGTVIGTTGHRDGPNSGVLTHYSRGAVAAFDDRYNTFYDGATKDTSWTGLDLGSPKHITQIRYMPAQKDNGGTRMLGGVFEGSNSPTFDSRVVLHTITTAPNSDVAVYVTAAVTDTGSYRYVRYVGPFGSYCNVASILFYTGSLAAAPEDNDVIVLDNESPSVTLTGTWGTSTAHGLYGPNTRHDTASQKGTSSARFTPTLTSPGLYQVFIRWNADPNRSDKVPVDINHLGGTALVEVNQKINGGQWQSLGTYGFDAGTDGNVLIRTGGTTGLVIADAVMFMKVADVEEEVEIIMDNTTAPGVTLTGAWTPATTVPGYWGSNYAHDGDTGKGTKTARFTPTITDAGDYEVFVLWTGRSINASSVPVTVTHADGSDTIPVDQTTGNGEWFSLGVHPFAAGTTGNVLISNTDTTGRVVVDAVRYHKSGPPRTTIITSDTEDASGVTVVGGWTPSYAVPGYNGSNYLQDGGTEKGSKTVTFAPNLPQAGVYDVYMNWTPSANRAPSVTVRIDHAAGTDYKTINQQSYGGSRLRLGSYSFTAGTAGKVIISNANTTGYVIVDSVRFELN